jgi:hypothetical protein
MASFEIMKNDLFESNAAAIFSILATNMTVIAPTGNTYDEDFRSWKQAVENGLQKQEISIILIKNDGALIGYFQYSVNNDTFIMEEIEFIQEWQGQNNLFKQLYGFMLSTLPENIVYVEAYSHKNNAKSQGILQHLVLEIIGENKSGKSYHFKGLHDDLKKWYYKE